MVYIGETKRPLKVRIEEHRRNTRLGYRDNSRIAEHSWANDHRVQWNSATLIDTEAHEKKRKIKESLYMNIKQKDRVIS